ncbi:DUF3307 domain-containing protein [Roseicyclus mahoneyensis]|uniref:Uncharacterized protein DUF3307 n=1 Tax=Roseicyclus mahoneyensis TaxID=164332 RepID=A0A316H593_9RHOB|nr:DUF3307 domain-containing protein [Roseicyclus mahoneyensis]PWK62753.1 uncharacterized protein DUF3307 [Roseicyclus mahoneyensis]
MAASTFAALYLAHVIADYLLQTRWMVENKDRPAAIGLHIGVVLAMMPVVTLQLSWWFLALALAHLAIDLTKTHVLGGGLGAYVVDQMLHIVSILGVVALAPSLWAESPLSGIDWLARFYLILAVFLFAARGGQYAVAIALSTDPEADGRGVRLGWAERTALSALVAAGLPWAMPFILAVKAAQVARERPRRDGRGRARLIRGSALSMGWGLACAGGLWAILPSFG